MFISVLGPINVRSAEEDEPRSFRSERQMTALGSLVIAGPFGLGIDTLVNAVWGDSLPKNPRNSLRQLVFDLRRSLLDPNDTESVVVGRQPDGYALNFERVELDADAFTNLAERASKELAFGSAAAAQDVAEQALAMWRGEPYIDLRFVHDGEISLAARAERERLTELKASCHEVQIDARIAEDDLATVVADLKALIDLYPYREKLRGQLMIAQYRQGQQAAALETYELTRRFLGENLGIDPSPELRDLELSVLHQSIPQLPFVQRHSVTRTPSKTPGLPSRKSNYQPREELEALVVRRILDARRESPARVVLTGFGGIGKSRTTIEIGHRLLGEGFRTEYLDVHMLTPIEVASAVEGLGREWGPGSALIVDGLATTAAGDAIISTLSSLNCAVLLTSRGSPGLDDELTVRVDPLGHVGTDSPAVRLITKLLGVDSAALDDVMVAHLEYAVARLEGVPIAIEHASRALRGAAIDQTSVTLALQHALGPEEPGGMYEIVRDCVEAAGINGMGMAALSAFVGSFPTDAAIAVLEDVHDTPGRGMRRLTEAVSSSLVEPPVEGRFHVLRPVRHIVASHGLGQEARQRAQERIALWLLELSATIEASGLASEKGLAAMRFMRERDQILATTRWAIGEGNHPEFLDQLLRGMASVIITRRAAGDPTSHLTTAMALSQLGIAP